MGWCNILYLRGISRPLTRQNLELSCHGHRGPLFDLVFYLDAFDGDLHVSGHGLGLGGDGNPVHVRVVDIDVLDGEDGAYRFSQGVPPGDGLGQSLPQVGEGKLQKNVVVASFRPQMDAGPDDILICYLAFHDPFVHGHSHSFPVIESARREPVEQLTRRAVSQQ